MRTHISKQGETLSSICLASYGKVDGFILKTLLDSNPHLLDKPYKLDAGVAIKIPELPLNELESLIYKKIKRESIW